MDTNFWHQRWQDNAIGFHKDEINPYLKSYWPQLLAGIDKAPPVLVPLCGKSLDMIWLSELGHDVLGVEVSQIAVQDFFAENNLEPEIVQRGEFKHWRAGRIEIICGDFFALPKEAFEHVRCVYDRAALVALPTAMRETYAAYLQQVLAPGVRMLLVTLEYPQSQMDGPPFSVDEAEVEALYGRQFDINALACMDVLDENAHLKQKGLGSLVEKVYTLVRR